MTEGARSQTLSPRQVRRRRVIVLVVIAALVVGTALAAYLLLRPEPLPAEDYSSTIKVNNREYVYYVHLPRTGRCHRRWPLLLVFHGYKHPVDHLRALTAFDALADEQGFIAVYPEGYRNQWVVDDTYGSSHDVEFVSALLDQLQSDLPVDPARIYAAGLSNGAFFVSRLACELPDRIAAFGAVAGTMSRNLKDECSPSRPVPIVLIHGTADTFVPFDSQTAHPFSYSVSVTVPETTAYWVDVNGCSTSSSVYALPDVPSDGTRVWREVYGDCRGGVEVVLYVIEGGGHTWPGNTDTRFADEARAGGYGNISADLDASAALWEFVASYALP